MVFLDINKLAHLQQLNSVYSKESTTAILAMCLHEHDLITVCGLAKSFDLSGNWLPEVDGGSTSGNRWQQVAGNRLQAISHHTRGNSLPTTVVGNKLPESCLVYGGL